MLTMDFTSGWAYFNCFILLFQNINIFSFSFVHWSDSAHKSLLVSCRCSGTKSEKKVRVSTCSFLQYGIPSVLHYEYPSLQLYLVFQSRRSLFSHSVGWRSGSHSAEQSKEAHLGLFKLLIFFPVLDIPLLLIREFPRATDFWDIWRF